MTLPQLIRISFTGCVCKVLASRFAWLWIGFFVVFITPTWAADDLLDPRSVIRPRQEANSDSAPSSSPNADTVRRADDFTWRGHAGYARSMASSVVASLQGLVQSFNGLHEALSKLQIAIIDNEAKRSKLIESKEAEMADYRAGLFCSGCKQTRTRILALGQKFPHEGQRIIRPTAEEIAAKERELQAPIDRLEEDIREARSKKDKADKERVEAEEQLRYGYKLWRAAIIFEGRIFYRTERETEAAYISSLTTADDQIVKLGKEIEKADKAFHEALGSRKSEFLRIQGQQQETQNTHESNRKELEDKIANLRLQPAKDGVSTDNARTVELQLSELTTELAQNVAAYKRDMAGLEAHMEKLGIENIKPSYDKLRAELANDLAFWNSKHTSIKRQHDEDVRLHKERLGTSSTARQKEQEQLIALTQTSVPMMKILGLAVYPLTTFADYWHNHMLFPELGGFYRMGDFQPARHNEVLPTVQRFIEIFRTTWNFQHVSTAIQNEAAAPAENRSVPIQKRLRDLLELPPPPRRSTP